MKQTVAEFQSVMEKCDLFVDFRLPSDLEQQIASNAAAAGMRARKIDGKKSSTEELYDLVQAGAQRLSLSKAAIQSFVKLVQAVLYTIKETSFIHAFTERRLCFVGAGWLR